MNWKEIKEKYPKGWNKLVGFVRTRLGIIWNDEYNIWTVYDDIMSYSLFRDLYSFFDEQGIYITLGFDIDLGTEICSFDEWAYDIGTQFGLSAISEYDHATRKEAEEQAFMEAFEILEEQLK